MSKDKKASGSTQGKRTGSSKVRAAAGAIDKELAMELYSRGMRDIELAHALQVSREDIVKWRKEAGLAANRIAVWDTEKAMKLYNEKASDSIIAAELSKAGGHVSAASVSAWRREQGLPSNPTSAWKRGQDGGQVGGDSKSQLDSDKVLEAIMQTALSDKFEAAKKAGLPLGPFAPEMPQEPEPHKKEIHTDQKRRTHLVAVPPRRTHDIEEEAEPGRRRRRQKVRNIGVLPLAGVFRMPEPDPFADMMGMGLTEESDDPEQDAVFLFASILNICRQQFDWSDRDLYDFLDAIEFTAQMLYDIEEAAMLPLELDPSPMDSGPAAQNRGSKRTGGKKKKGTSKKRR